MNLASIEDNEIKRREPGTSIGRSPRNLPLSRTAKTANFTDILRDFTWLALSNGAGMILSFIFWIVVAQAAPTSVLGKAGSLLALSMFVSTLGCLGLWTGIVRFLHKFQAVSRAANYFVSIGFVAASLFSVAAVTALILLGESRNLGLVNARTISLFVSITAFGSVNSLLDSSLLSMGKSSFITARSCASGATRLMLVSVSQITVESIMMSWLIGSVLASGIGESVMILKDKTRSKEKQDLRATTRLKSEVLRFSLLYAIGGFIWGIPNGIFPLLATSILGSESAGQYYVATTIGSILVMTIQTMTQSAFNQASKTDEVSFDFFKRIMSFILILPSIALVVVLLFGHFMLSFFGPSYEAKSFLPLIVLVVSCFFLAVVSVYVTILTVAKRIHSVNLVYASSSILILVVGTYAMTSYGITGIALGYLAGYAVASVLALRGAKNLDENLSRRT